MQAWKDSDFFQSCFKYYLKLKTSQSLFCHFLREESCGGGGFFFFFFFQVVTFQTAPSCSNISTCWTLVVWPHTTRQFRLANPQPQRCESPWGPSPQIHMMTPLRWTFTSTPYSVTTSSLPCIPKTEFQLFPRQTSLGPPMECRVGQMGLIQATL